MTHKIILNANNTPFLDEISANQVAIILSRELGQNHIATKHEQGYGIVCENKQPATSDTVKKNHAVDTESDEHYFRPALRSQVGLFFKLILGLFVLAFIDPILQFAQLDILQMVINNNTAINFTWNSLVTIFRVLGFVVVSYWAISILIYIYSRDYFIGPKGVESNYGFYSKDQNRVEFRQVSNISMKQSIIERLMGIGTIEIFTSASDGSEITFENIARPAEVLSNLRERSKAYS